MTRQEIAEMRKELFKLMNGDVFYTMRQWPQWVQTAFWRNPIGDTETFKLALFFIGNGCEPSIVKKWIMSSLEWEPSYTEKDERAKRRARQLEFVHGNVGHKAREWFYFDS